MNDKDIYKYTEIIFQGKSYQDEQIRNNPLILNKLSQSMIFYPVSFLEKVKKENGLIRLEFKEDNKMVKSLINVSDSLLNEFYSVYH